MAITNDQQIKCRTGVGEGEHLNFRVQAGLGDAAQFAVGSDFYRSVYRNSRLPRKNRSFCIRYVPSSLHTPCGLLFPVVILTTQLSRTAFHYQHHGLPDSDERTLYDWLISPCLLLSRFELSGRLALRFPMSSARPVVARTDEPGTGLALSVLP